MHSIETEEKPKHASKVSLNTSLKLKSKTSINAIIESKSKKEKSVVEETLDIEKMPKTSFTPADLEGKWARFAHQIKENGNNSLYATLTLSLIHI